MSIWKYASTIDEITPGEKLLADKANAILNSMPNKSAFLYSDEPRYTKDGDKFVLSYKNSKDESNIGVAGPNVLNIVKKIKFINCDDKGYCQLQFDGNNTDCINLGNNNIVNEGMCTNADEQKWRFVDGNIVSKKTRQCMVKSIFDVDASTPDRSSGTRGDIVMLDCGTTNNWKTIQSIYDPSVNISEGNIILSSTTNISNSFLYNDVFTKLGNNAIVYCDYDSTITNDKNCYIGDPIINQANKVTQADCDSRGFCRLNVTDRGCLFVTNDDIISTGNNGQSTTNKRIKTGMCSGFGTDDQKARWRYQLVQGSEPKVYKFHSLTDPTKCLSYDSNTNLVLTDCTIQVPNSIIWRN